jgi:hypothetical protein
MHNAATEYTPARAPRRRRRQAASSPTTAPVALQVMGVENVAYDEPLLSFTLVFNTTAEDPLVADTLDPMNWSAVYQGVGYYGYDANVVAFDRIDVIVQADAPTPGADAVAYAADPADVSDTGGRVLAAFSGLPL